MRNETVNNSNPSGRGRVVEEDLANGFQLLVFLGSCNQTIEHALVEAEPINYIGLDEQTSSSWNDGEAIVPTGIHGCPNQ